jgi:molybdopterin converting factor subunit 1
VRVTVRYFAALRDAAGTAREDVEGPFVTAADLWTWLGSRHVLAMAPESLRVSVNAAYVPWTTALADGDEIAFIPPVSGG